MAHIPAPIICLMGPTASGKTDLAIELCGQFPFEIVSVDSVMVYRQMNIGSAKPSADILQKIPHHLIDILDPKEIYSAGLFHQDAMCVIKKIIDRGKWPLLVGGTMLYFRVLQQGIANLPRANEELRSQWQALAKKEGWPALHGLLKQLDPDAASRIQEQDSQRIQRALEINVLTGKTLAHHHSQTHSSAYQFYSLGIIPEDRKLLHERIAERFTKMIKLGLVPEVQALLQRGDLQADLPSLRSVGYQQVWAYLNNQITYQEMIDQAIVATRQLAKRQMTWLRTWPHLHHFPAEDNYLLAKMIEWIRSKMPTS